MAGKRNLFTDYLKPDEAKQFKARWEADEARVKQARENRRQEFLRARTFRKQWKSVEETYKENQRATGLVEATKARAQAVLRSYGISLPITVVVSDDPDGNIAAFTDYRKIHITYPRKFIPEFKDGEMQHLDKINDLLGLLYHEGGHLRFSMPYPEMVIRGNPDVFGTDVAKSLREIDDHAGAFWEMSNKFSKFKLAANILEDERMECLQVEDSPVLAEYFTDLTLERMVPKNDPTELWPMVCGRTFLPQEVRLAAAAGFHHGPVAAAECQRIMDDYKFAKDPIARWKAVEEFYQFLEDHQIEGDGGPGQHKDTSAGTRDGDNKRQTKKMGRGQEQDRNPQGGGSKGEDGDEDGEGEGQSKGQPGDEEGEDGEGEGDGQSGDGEGDPTDGDRSLKEGRIGTKTGKAITGKSSPTTGAGGDSRADGPEYDVEPMSLDEIRSEIERVRAERAEHPYLAASAMSVEDAARSFAKGITRAMANPESGFAPLDRTQPLDQNMVTMGITLANPIKKALEVAIINAAPSWQRGERNGVLMPIDYRARKPGDLNFNRRYNDSGEPAIDVSVSLVLDVSGSMSGRGPELGAVNYGVATACEQLGVPYRTVIFGSEDEYHLIASSERPFEAQEPPIMGGTNPEGALNALSRCPIETKHHLLIVFTDGQFEYGWQGIKSHRWPENTHSICLVEGVGGGWSAKDKGFDEVMEIQGLPEIPQRLEKFLQRYVARSA